jgi:hypothetical protein
MFAASVRLICPIRGLAPDRTMSAPPAPDDRRRLTASLTERGRLAVLAVLIGLAHPGGDP